MSDNPEKPRVRVPAGSNKHFVADSFQNFAASLGYGASNLASASTYGFNPISRNRQLLDYMYRGSWLVKQVVDAVADDMTREGIVVESDIPPDEIDKLHKYMGAKLIWPRINKTLKWSRLYGGAIAVIMINGQKPDTPLKIETIGKDQFDGIKVFDRWMLWPSLSELVTDLGEDYGNPKYYDIVSDAKTEPRMKVHHSRCIRIEGVELPYWQKISENGWGLSVIEPLYDRLIAFDSASQGAAQLVYRAHLRTLKIEKLRELIAFGGEGYQAVVQQMAMIRLMQSNEGLTVLDSTDEFETHAFAFGGLSDIINTFAQQLSGAAQIPLVRLLGQSPAGLNSTGESDIRNYYDSCNAQQEARLRQPMSRLLDICHRSLFGKELPEGFNFSFAPLWQLNDEQKATIATTLTTAICKAAEDMIITPAVALKELRQQSKITGVFSNISDEDIQAAEEAPPPFSELATEGLGGPQGVSGGPGARQNPNAAEDASEAKQSPDQEKMPPTNKGHVAKQFSHATADALNEGIILGPDDDSNAVWMVQEHDPDTKEFDDLKFLVQFTNRDEAMEAYKTRTPDAEARIGSIKRINKSVYDKYVQDGNIGTVANGHLG